MVNLLNQPAKAYELPSTLQGFDFNPNIQLRSELASPFDSRITGYRAASYASGFLSDYIPTTEEIQKVLQTLPTDLPITVIISDGMGKTTATRHQLNASGEFKITHFDNLEDAYAPQSITEEKMFDEVTTFSEILGTLKANFQDNFEFLPQSVSSVAFTFGGSDLVETPMFDSVTTFSEILGALKANFQGSFEFLPQSVPSVAFTFGGNDLNETPMFDDVTTFFEILGTLKANFQGSFEFLPQSVPSVAFTFGSNNFEVEPVAFMQSAVQPLEVQPTEFSTMPFVQIEIIDPAKLTKVAAAQIDANQFVTLTNVQIELI